MKDLFRALAAVAREGEISPSLVSYAGYSRFALLNILKVLGFGAGTRVLLPAYICDVVLLPLAELGIEPVYYGITGDFQVDFGTVRVSPDTRALITVNYFGISLDYGAIEAFTRENGLVWVNDNAHGFASCCGNRKLEEFGDVSVTSFRKIIPSLNGSRILINNRSYGYLKRELDRLNDSGATESGGRYFIGNMLRSLGISLRSFPDYSDIRGFEDRNPCKYRLDDLSLKLLLISDEKSIRERRRELFFKIEDFFKTGNYGFMGMPSNILKENNSPMVFPIIVEDNRIWKSILHKSRELGVDIHTWPSLPREVIERNQYKSVDMWEKLLFLPLHQDMDAGAYLPLLKRVFDAVRVH